MSNLEISVILSTFERPQHLRRSLLSLALQEGVDGLFEVIVADDGSTGTTREIVQQFARQSQFPVKFTTHPHDGFRLSRCRNEGIAKSAAPYLLFTDADCLLPADHLQWHLNYRTNGYLITGDCYRLDDQTSASISDDVIRSQTYRDWISPRERRRLEAKSRNAWWYERLGFRNLPRATGCNMGIWRRDLLAVNGFDESFIGWGLEDRDLQLRLAQRGCRSKSILSRTAAYHLWHPPHASFVRNNVGTPNLTYFQRPNRPIRCKVGLDQHLTQTPHPTFAV